MDSLQLLLDGFGVALQPTNLLFAFVGVLLGTAVGILPGIGPALTVALLLPVTYGLEPIAAFIMFAGIYYGAMYGGAISSIMLGIPGASTAVATTFDGRPLALKGLADRALVARHTPQTDFGDVAVIFG